VIRFSNADANIRKFSKPYISIISNSLKNVYIFIRSSNDVPWAVGSVSFPATISTSVLRQMCYALRRSM